jgi:hypothetical protein
LSFHISGEFYIIKQINVYISWNCINPSFIFFTTVDCICGDVQRWLRNDKYDEWIYSLFSILEMWCHVRLRQVHEQKQSCRKGNVMFTCWFTFLLFHLCYLVNFITPKNFVKLWIYDMKYFTHVNGLLLISFR